MILEEVKFDHLRIKALLTKRNPIIKLPNEFKNNFWISKASFEFLKVMSNGPNKTITQV